MLSLKQRMTMSFLGEFCCLYDENLTLVSDAKELSGLFGCSADDMIKKCQNGLMGLVSQDLRNDIYNQLQIQLRESGQIEIMVPVYDANNNEKWIMNRAVLVCEEEKEYIHGILVDLTRTKLEYEEEKERSNALKLQVQQDSLTKIYNAATARKLVEEYLKDNENCAILVMDIDNFKMTNDRYGHLFGDSVIITAAKTLKNLFRTNDIVGRVGGDEFMVLMKDIKSRDIVKKRCEQLNENFKNALQNQIKDFEVGFSIGVALTPDHGDNYFDLFLAADQAMYHSKKMGGRQYSIYSEESCGPLKSKSEMEYANYNESMLNGYIE